jgi:hypothetical protein
MKLFNEYEQAIKQARRGRSRYVPHQSAREMNRRIRQAMNGQLEMAGVTELRSAWNAFEARMAVIDGAA